MDCRTETNLLPDPVAVSDPEVEALRQNRLDREIYDAAIQVLRETSAEQPLRTSEVLAEIGKRISTQPKGYQVYGVLLRASKLPGSPINSRKGPGGGYYYGAIENVLVPEDPAQLISAAETAGEVLEGHLYPLVSEWFKVVKGLPNTSHRVSSLKSGGMWSNPDIVALAPFDDLGFFDVEITTAEVKRSSQRWEINFFQAVSHKRFSDRSYFIVRTADGSVNDLDSMAAYAEKYGVGLVVLPLSDQQCRQLMDWDQLPVESKTDFLELIMEPFPAPYCPIPVKEKAQFLRRIGITSRAEIYGFA